MTLDTMDTMYALPPLPAARSHTLALLLQPQVSLAEVAAIAEGDPALTATLLHAANSAYSSPVDEVRRAADALVRLGVEDSRGIILATLLRDTTTAALERSELDIDTLWRHTLAVALLAEALCAVDSSLASVQPVAFTTGILHDIGRLVLAARHPRRYARVVRLARRGMPIMEAEASQFGTDHASFGGGVALAWGLPEVIARAIGAHGTGGDPLSDVLVSAIALTRALGIGDGVLPAPLPSMELVAGSAALRILGGPGALLRRIEWFRAALGA
ncbi:MAG: HDOD domain-containing protein [Dehalococcoidia bacterium]